jgi:hypothetical protein
MPGIKKNEFAGIIYGDDDAQNKRQSSGNLHRRYAFIVDLSRRNELKKL